LACLRAGATDQTLQERVTGLFKERQWAEAQVMLEKVTAEEPKNAEAWNFLGQAFLSHNDYEKAMPALEMATQLAPANSEYMRMLGDACGLAAQQSGLLSKYGWAKKCKADYDRSVELDPTNIAARWSVMEFCRQAPAIVGGGMDGAYAQAEAIRKLDPDRGRVALAILYVADKKMVEAFALYDEALKANPDDYTTLYQLGRLSAMTGQRLEQGLVNLRKCLTLTIPPSQPGLAPVNWRIGNILEKLGDKTGAKAAYEASIAIDPTFVQAIEALRKL
jgi:tetratricopeptide (TPR) repeat protein